MSEFEDHMAYSIDSHKIQKIVQRIDPTSHLERSWRLDGGVSAQMIAVELLRENGNLQKVVIRWHGDVNRNEYGHIVEREYHLLSQLMNEHIPVAEPLLLDNSGDIFVTNFLVLHYVPGETHFSLPYRYDYLRQAAETLAHIHQVELGRSTKALLPSQMEICSRQIAQHPEHLDTSLDEGHIREVLHAAWPWVMENKAAFLHGDYWPGNWLWNNHTLSAVIDWEDAKLGDPLADLAISRLDVLWAFGQTAMDTFTNIYKKLMPMINFAALPYWDLYSALRPMNQLAEWALGWADYGRVDVTVDTMREAHSWFVAQALDKLALRD